MNHARAKARRGLARRDVAVIVLLAGIALLLMFPWILQQQTQSRRNLCDKRQQDLAKAITLYEEVNEWFPGYRNLQAIDRNGRRRPASWVFASLEYYEFDAKGNVGPYAEMIEKYGPLGDDQTRGQPPEMYIAALVCPENLPPGNKATPGWLSYVANCGLPDVEPTDGFPPDWPANGVFLDRFREPVRNVYPYVVTGEFLLEHDDDEPQEDGKHDAERESDNDHRRPFLGGSYTLLISENVDSGLWTDTSEAQIGFMWTPTLAAPHEPPAVQILHINQRRGEGDGGIEFARPASYHVGGVNVAYVSGATAFINESISPVVLARAMAPDDAGITWPGSDEPIGKPYRRVAEVRGVDPGEPATKE